jgi:putative membrane protein
MNNYFIRLVIVAIAVWFASVKINGVSVTKPEGAIIVALALSFLNTFVKPILKIVSFPLTLLSLGLFLLVINVAILYIAAYFIPSFTVKGFTGPLIFSLVISVVSSVANFFFD